MIKLELLGKNKLNKDKIYSYSITVSLWVDFRIDLES